MTLRINTFFLFIVFGISSLVCGKVMAQSEFEYTIPNIFTPNNDGRNDLFLITGKSISKVNCKIYNRYGILVNEWNTTLGGWDGGDFSGEKMPEGVYFITVEITGMSGESVKESRSITLIR